MTPSEISGFFGSSLALIAVLAIAAYKVLRWLGWDDE